MSNPLGRIGTELSPEADSYSRETREAGALAIRKLRMLAGLDMGPLELGQRAGMQPSVRELSQAVTGIRPAPLPEAVDTIMRNNPRDGRDFNLFDTSRLTQSYGETVFVEDEPKMTEDPRKSMGTPMTGPTVHDRNWVDKVGRALRASDFGTDPSEYGNLSEQEQQAIRLERKKIYAGAGEAVIEQVNNLAQYGLTFLDTFGRGDRAAQQAKLADNLDAQGGTAVERLQRRHAAFRLESAQRALNSINEFKKNASAAAAAEGLPGADIEEAETWGRNTGYMIGLTPFAAAIEVGVSARLAAFGIGITGRGILGSSILRHSIASGAANAAMVPYGSPMLPDTATDAGLDQAAEDFFLTPNYAGAFTLGAGLGAAASWMLPRIMNAFRPKQNRALPIIYDDTRGFHRQQAPQVDPNLGIPDAEWEIVRDAGAPPQTVELGITAPRTPGRAAPSGPVGPFYFDTPASQPRPLAGLLTDGSEKIGFVGDPNGPIFPPATVDPSFNPFTVESQVDVTVAPFEDVSVNVDVDVSVDATYVPRKRAPRKVIVKVDGQLGPSVIPPEPLSGPISTAPLSPADFPGPAFEPVIGGNPTIEGFRNMLGPLFAGTADDYFGASLPAPVDGTLGALGQATPAPQPQFGEQLGFDFGGVNVAPTTNAPAVIPQVTSPLPSSTPVPLVDQIFGGAIQIERLPADLDFGFGPGVEDPVVDLSGPITTEEKLVAAGMEPEAAALVQVDAVSTVEPIRARPPGNAVSGHELAALMGSAYNGPDGKPMLVYGVGDANQVRVYNENGIQTLLGGRSVMYFTTDAEAAGGVLGEQYAIQQVGQGSYPVPTTGNQPTPLVTNSARQAQLATEQTRARIDRMRRRLAAAPPEGALADGLRQQIAAAETLAKRQQIPASALTPMYVISRRHLDLNEPMRGDMFEMDPAERTGAEDLMVAAIETLMANEGRTAASILKKVMPMLEAGKFNLTGGGRKLYNAVAFNAVGESMVMKGSTFNKALQAVGVDTMSMAKTEGISGGDSEAGAIKGDIVMVLDPRAVVPALAVDTQIIADAAALHGIQMSKMAAVVSDPARPDLPRIKNIGDIDAVGSRLIVQQNEHVVIRNPTSASGLMAEAKTEYPEAYVQALTDNTGRVSVYVGAKPLDFKAQEAYTATGYYPGQTVKDMRNSGLERYVKYVELDPDDLTTWTIKFAPLRQGAWGGKSMAITPAVKARFIPGTASAPVIDGDGKALWAEFQTFASAYIGQLNGAGKTVADSLFSPDARAVLPDALKSWFDSRDIVNVLERKAVTTMFGQLFVEDHRNLAPQAGAFYEDMKQMAVEFTDGVAVAPTLDEMAHARGMTVVKVPGGSEIILQSGSTAEIVSLDSSLAAREYLTTFEPVELPLEPASLAPSELGAAPSGTMPMTRAMEAERGVDPSAYEGREAEIDSAIDDMLPLGREIEEEFGPQMTGPGMPYVDVEVTVGGTRVPTIGTNALAGIVKQQRAVLNKSPGWFQPNHSWWGGIEQQLYNITDSAGNRPFAMLRPYADIEALKRAQAVALERGNPAYKALEAIRRKADFETMADGTMWDLLALPTLPQRVAYVQKNGLSMNLLDTAKELDDAIDLTFGTPAVRALHWNEIVSYVQNLGRIQRMNRTANSPFIQTAYDDAAVGLVNIEWFKGHAHSQTYMAETVNPIDLINRVTHSYNFAKYVEPSAKTVEQVWRKVGAIKMPMIAGKEATPLEPYMNEMLDWVQLLRNGQTPNQTDWVPQALSVISRKLGVPLTVGESKKFLSMIHSNLAKSYMGWVPAPAIRDFTQASHTMAFTGEGPMAQAIAEFTSSSRSAIVFAELRDLGLASTENELQSADPFLNAGIGDGEVYSSFNDREIRWRTNLQNLAIAITSRTPSRIRNLQDSGMYLYLKSNSISRALSARASLIHFENLTAKYGFDKMNAAQFVNVAVNDPGQVKAFMQDLRITMQPTVRRVQDLMEQGDMRGAMAEYAQHAVAISQGMYGPLHTGKFFRTTSGRLGGMFQNYGIFQLDEIHQLSGLGPAAADMGATNRAMFLARYAAYVGGAAWLYSYIKDRYGMDIENWSWLNTARNQLPIGPGPITDAAAKTYQDVSAYLSEDSDYPKDPSRGGVGLGGLMGNAAVPLLRPIGKWTDMVEGARYSENGLNETLNFILSNRTGVNRVQENVRESRELREAEAGLEAERAKGGGGAE